MKYALVSTLMHVIELAVCLLGAWLILTFFQVDSGAVKILAGIAIDGLSKFSRANDAIPIGDFVNDR